MAIHHDREIGSLAVPRFFLDKQQAGDGDTMIATNDEARAALFAGFDGFQASFSAFLAAYAKEKDAARRSAMATRFAR
ncbi:MAG: hypothetical protein Q6373_010965, partial [Candidatus Sigynarchaeota archaeon]